MENVCYLAHCTPFNNGYATDEDADEQTYYTHAHGTTPQHQRMTVQFICADTDQCVTVRRLPVDVQLDNHGLVAGQQHVFLNLLCQLHHLREHHGWDFWRRVVQSQPSLLPAEAIARALLRIHHSTRFEMHITDEADFNVRAVYTRQPTTFLHSQHDIGYFPFATFVGRIPDPTAFLTPDVAEYPTSFASIVPDHSYNGAQALSAGPQGFSLQVS